MKGKNILIAFYGILVFILVFYKSYVSSFTHDESYSFLFYRNDAFLDLLSFKSCYTNNHILNSIFIKFINNYVGNEEWMLRFPNVLLFGVYLLYLFKLLKPFKWWIFAGGFVILSTNLLFVDLFSLARGYGLSMGFMVMGIYYGLQFLKCNKLKYLYIFHLAFLLAILSSFTLIIVYVSAFAAMHILLHYHTYTTTGKLKLIDSIKINAIPLLFNVIVLYEPLRRVLTRSSLGFGGKNGFFQDTVFHLLLHSFNEKTAESYGLIISYVIFTLIMIALILLLSYHFYKKNSFINENKIFIFFQMTFIFTCTSIILAHLILGVDYPVARFSAFLIPIFLFTLIGGIQYVSFFKNKFIPSSIMTVWVVFTITMFVKKVTLNATMEWRFDMHTKNMLETLDKKRNNKQVNLGINWLFEPTINFYRITKDYNWLNEVDRDGIDENHNFYYIFEEGKEELVYPVTEIKTFKETNTILYKKL